MTEHRKIIKDEEKEVVQRLKNGLPQNAETNVKIKRAILSLNKTREVTKGMLDQPIDI